jgi:type II secretory pathway pseudopilin PulG
MMAQRKADGGYSLLELIVAAGCTTLLAGAVLPLLVGGASAERHRSRLLSAELRLDSALRAVTLDLRAAGVGLEGADSVERDGHVETIAGPAAGGGLRVLRTLGPAHEITAAIDSDSYRLGDSGNLQPGALVLAVGLPERPPGAPLPAGTVISVFPTGQGAIVDISWGSSAGDVLAWGPPRALLPVTWREYQLRSLDDAYQLRRRDLGGSWQPVVDELSGLAIDYLVDRNGDSMPDDVISSGTSPDAGERILIVRLEAHAAPAFAREIEAMAWVRVRSQ